MEKIQYPANYYFTSAHEWINIVSDELVYVGLTELAIRELNEIEKIEIYSTGKIVQKNQVLGRIINRNYSTKLIMPLSGTVAEVNPEFSTDPKVIDEQYCHDNWIIKLKPIHPVDINKLFSLARYKELNITRSLHLIQYVNDPDCFSVN